VYFTNFAYDSYTGERFFISVDNGAFTETTGTALTTEGMHVLSNYVHDNAGNYTVTNVANIMVDWTPPTATTITPPTLFASATNFTVTMSATDALTGVTIYYSTNTAGPITPNISSTSPLSITISTNGGTQTYTLVCFAVDGAGNTNIWQTNQYIINILPPEISFSEPATNVIFYTNASFSIDTVISGGGDVVAYHSISSNAFIMAPLMTTNGEAILLYPETEYIIISYATNTNTALSSPYRTNTYILDTVSPVVLSNNTATFNTYYTNNSPVHITNFYTDSLSGVNNTFIRTNGSGWISSTNISLINDGIYILETYCSDNAGNASITNSNTFVIDTTSPVYQSNNYALNNGDSITNNTVAFTNYFTDNLTGNNSWFITNGTLVSGDSIILSDPGIFFIQYFSIDNAGNYSVTNSNTIVIPSSNYNFNYIYPVQQGSYGYISGTNALISGTLSPFLIGIDSLYMTVTNGEPWQILPTAFPYAWSNYLNTTNYTDGMYTFRYIWTTPSATNTNATREIIIDNTPPTALISRTNTVYYSEFLPVTLSGTDTYGISAVVYTVDGSIPSPTNGLSNANNFQLNITGNVTVNVKVIDLAGNWSTNTATATFTKSSIVPEVEILISENPYNPETGTTKLTAKKTKIQKVDLIIMDINGRVQQILEDDTPNEPISEYTFDGVDFQGKFMGRGLYLVMPKTDEKLDRKSLRKLYILYE
jgi:hypothetical protein